MHLFKILRISYLVLFMLINTIFNHAFADTLNNAVEAGKDPTQRQTCMSTLVGMYWNVCTTLRRVTGTEFYSLRVFRTVGVENTYNCLTRLHSLITGVCGCQSIPFKLTLAEADRSIVYC